MRRAKGSANEDRIARGVSLTCPCRTDSQIRRACGAGFRRGVGRLRTKLALWGQTSMNRPKRKSRR